MIRLLNIIHQDGSGHTLEIDSPVNYLFDYCTMLHQQMQNGAIPINCKIHSIIPQDSIVVDLKKPIEPDLLTQILESVESFNPEQIQLLKNKGFKK